MTGLRETAGAVAERIVALHHLTLGPGDELNGPGVLAAPFLLVVMDPVQADRYRDHQRVILPERSRSVSMLSCTVSMGRRMVPRAADDGGGGPRESSCYRRRSKSMSTMMTMTTTVPIPI